MGAGVSKVQKLLKLATGPAAIYLVAASLVRVASFVLIPLYTRRMTPAEYGEYAVAQLAIGFLPVLLTLAMVSAMARFYFDDDRVVGRQRAGGVARWVIVFGLIGGALVTGGIVLLAPAGQGGIGHRWELCCIVWAAVGSLLASIPATYLRSEQRAITAAIFQFGQFITIVVAGVVLVGVYHRGLRGSLEAAALAYSVDGLVGVIYVAIAMKGPMTRALLREAIRFSAPFLPHFTANNLQSTGDRWVLKALGRNAALGNYGLAYQVITPAMMVLQSWNEATSPEMGEIYRQGGAAGLRKSFGSVARSYVLAALLPTLGIIAALPLIKLIVGARFAAAIWQVPLLGACTLVDSMYYPSVNTLFYLNRTTPIPIITVATGLINLALSVVFISMFGVLGAVLARLLSSAFRSVTIGLTARSALNRDANRPPDQAVIDAAGPARGTAVE
jgi:O-antigen/teichoic acid export membrane protein